MSNILWEDKQSEVTQKITWRDRQRAVREEAILDSTSELLTKVGYTAMSMDEVAEHVGISKATLYQHFASKEELAVYTIVRKMRLTVDFIAAQDAALPAIERLHQVIARILERRLTRRRTNVNMTHTMPQHILLEHPHYKEGRAQVENTMAALIEEAKAQGDIDGRYATPIVAQMLLSCATDANYEIMVRDGAVTPQALTEAILGLVFNGIRKR